LKFSTKTRYGIRAMLEISSHDPKNGVLQKDIATNQEISVKYLDHIISALKSAGLINNIKGKKSGYVLTRKPEEISILDIHKAFENGICVIDCMAINAECDRISICKTKKFWKGLNNIVHDYFQNTTLADIIDTGF
jgi:Rrf2 family protein